MFRLLLPTRRSVQRRPLHALYQHHIQHRSLHTSLRKLDLPDQEDQLRPRKANQDASSSLPEASGPLGQDARPTTTSMPQVTIDTTGSAAAVPGQQTNLWTQSSLETWRAEQKAGGKRKAKGQSCRTIAQAEARAQKEAVKAKQQAELTQEAEEKARILAAKVQALKDEREAKKEANRKAKEDKLQVTKDRKEARTRRLEEEKVTKRKEAQEAKERQAAERAAKRKEFRDLRERQRIKREELRQARTKKAEEKAKREAPGGEDYVKKKEREKKIRQAKQYIQNAKLKNMDTPPEDVGEYLEWAYTRADGLGRKSDRRRINIISQSLANDVLERLKPSLDKNKGCDIIDINPGAAVWSATLHDYLKPRKHILIEPDAELYGPRLQPLLDSPDSKYTLVPKSGIIWRNLEEVLTETHLPFQEALKSGDPRLEQPNDTLLLVASLGYHPKLRFRGFPSFAQLVLHQLVESVRTHTLLQKYGRVRMLIWITETEALKALPKAVSARRKSAVDAEISCDIREIASSTTISAKNTRYVADSGFNTSNVLEVMDRMNAAGITVPAGRESDSMQVVNPTVPPATKMETAVELSTQTGDISKKKKISMNMTNPEFNERLRSLEEDYENGVFKENIQVSPTHPEAGKGETEALHWTPEYALLQVRRKQLESGRVLNKLKQDLVDEGISLFGLERENFLSAKSDVQEKQKAEIIERLLSLNDAVEEAEEYIAREYTFFLDNTLAGIARPPLLMWERRQYEPLKVHPDEFRPRQEMTLLDLQPKALWPILRKNYPENMETFDFIVSQLMITSNQSLKKGLESLAPGAFEWIVDHCPLLTDPTRGGSFLPGDMRIRMLSMGMLKQIIEAWMSWPFRPSRYELIARSGSDIYDPAAGEEDL